MERRATTDISNLHDEALIGMVVVDCSGVFGIEVVDNGWPPLSPQVILSSLSYTACRPCQERCARSKHESRDCRYCFPIGREKGRKYA
jgi:hypothetical protein